MFTRCFIERYWLSLCFLMLCGWVYFVTGPCLLSVITVNTYFSPQDNIHSKLLQTINATQYKIYAAVYLITDKTIVEALAKAKKERGVDVQIITDQLSLISAYGKVKMLIQQDVVVFVYQPPLSTYNTFLKTHSLMHHKFAIFDSTIWTGSFNWTCSADKRNKENVITIANDSCACTKYLQQFDALKNECILEKPIPSTGGSTCLLKRSLMYRLKRYINFRSLRGLRRILRDV